MTSVHFQPSKAQDRFTPGIFWWICIQSKLDFDLGGWFWLVCGWFRSVGLLGNPVIHCPRYIQMWSVPRIDEVPRGIKLTSEGFIYAKLPDNKRATTQARYSKLPFYRFGLVCTHRTIWKFWNLCFGIWHEWSRPHPRQGLHCERSRRCMEIIVGFRSEDFGIFSLEFGIRDPPHRRHKTLYGDHRRISEWRFFSRIWQAWLTAISTDAVWRSWSDFAERFLISVIKCTHPKENKPTGYSLPPV